MFYSYFESLCEEKGISVNKACKEMGLSRSVAAKWKSTKTSPRMDTLKKISEYFNVSIDDLLSHSGENEKPATDNGNGFDKKHKLVNELFDRCSPDDQDLAINFLKSLSNRQSTPGGKQVTG